MDKKHVVFVDDEQFILRSLKRLFKSEDYECAYFLSGQETLDYMKDHKVDLLISDMRMPQMDGMELLTTVKNDYPEVIRIALSGFADKQMIFKLIEKNIAKVYLFKPWKSEDLKRSIQSILEYEELLQDRAVMELINNLDSVPSLPRIYAEITEMIENEASIESIGNLVENDQAISSKVLKLANSAFYGRKTGNVNQALVTIGLNNLKNMVLACSFFNMGKASMDYLEKMWDHSVLANKLTLKLYHYLFDERLSTLYSSVGLLHDIGKVIMFTHYHEKYLGLLKRSETSDETLIDIEHEELGMSHQELGAYLMNWWGLPYEYVEAAMYHHRPLDERVINKRLAIAIHLANFYACRLQEGCHSDYYLDLAVFKALKVGQQDVEKFIEEMGN